MDKLKLLSVTMLLVVLSIERTSVLSCPINCKCKARAAMCGPGLVSLPGGLDATVSVLAISGSKVNRNTINSLTANYFQSAQNLFSLVLTFSNVRSIAPGTFSGLNMLHDLSLADNNLSTLNADMFKGLPKLRTLDLSGNTNCQFDDSAFTHIAHIEELNIGKMGIRKLKRALFASFTNLKVLKLYENNIKRIRPEVLLPLSNLESLDLTGNELLGIPVELKPMFKKLKIVHLSENPWQCNCQLLWLKELKSSFTTSGLDTTEVICNGPAKIKYASLRNTPESEFKCIPPKVVHCDSTTYSVSPGDKLHISCLFEGDPIPDVEWLRPDGYRFNDTDLNYRQYNLMENGTIQINGIILGDDGAWRVRAYNGTMSDEMTIRIHVIITTTTQSTTSTSTTPTTSTSTTTRTTTTIRSTSTQLTKTSRTPVISAKTSTQASIPNSKIPSSVLSSQLPQLTTTNYPIPVHTDKPITQSGSGNGKVDVKDNGINYGLLVAAAVAGGTIVGVICLIIMCCQRKKAYEENKISPFDDDFAYDDGVRDSYI